MPLGRTLALLLPLALLWPGNAMAGPAPAQPEAPSAESRERAQQLFAESAAHYKKGEFGRAIELLREAFELAAEPVLLYNLGRAYQGDGQLDQAIAAYERYLELDPDIADRGALEKRIATLRRQIDERQDLERQAREARAGEARAAQRPPADDGPSAIPWVVTAVGAAGVVVGVVLGALASGREEDAEADPIHQSATDSLDDARTLATAANVSFIAGGAVAAAGLIWGIVDVAQSGDDADEPAVSVGIVPFGVTLSGPLPW